MLQEETKVHREYHGLVQVRHATGGNQITQRIPWTGAS